MHVVRRDVLASARTTRRRGRFSTWPLKGMVPEHAVERADAVGDDDEAAAVARRVVVADLALVLGPEGVEGPCPRGSSGRAFGNVARSTMVQCY